MIILLIGDWWNSLGSSLQIFWGISIIFSVLFVIQFVLSLIGLDFDSDTDTEAVGHDYSLDADFSLLSIRSIIAFFTFFGWTGVLVMTNGGNATMAGLFGLLSGLTAIRHKTSKVANYSTSKLIYGILPHVSETYLSADEVRQLYANFEAPIAALDCGQKCAPYNEGGKPFCCDICVAVPTLYQSEWDYLSARTDLWFEWKAESCTDTPEEAAEEVARLTEETQGTMILAECLGPAHCQRDYRGLTCRQFPFFPYIDSRGNVLGLSYYWEYEDKCWIISHLDVVTAEYRQEFLRAFAFNCGLTLHVEVKYGVNTHHIIEAIFKALGRALDQATGLDPRVKGTMSSKGTL